MRSTLTCFRSVPLVQRACWGDPQGHRPSLVLYFFPSCGCDIFALGGRLPPRLGGSGVPFRKGTPRWSRAGVGQPPSPLKTSSGSWTLHIRYKRNLHRYYIRYNPPVKTPESPHRATAGVDLTCARALTHPCSEKKYVRFGRVKNRTDLSVHSSQRSLSHGWRRRTSTNGKTTSASHCARMVWRLCSRPHKL